MRANQLTPEQKQDCQQAVTWLQTCQVTGFSSDSRHVGAQDAFVAYAFDARNDGRRYIAQAIEHGAKAVVWQEDGHAPSAITIAAATANLGVPELNICAGHIARMMGFRRTIPHMVMSGLIGGLLLVFADWCGRMIMFPYQIPAGLLSTFIGAPYFIYLLRKQSR